MQINYKDMFEVSYDTFEHFIHRYIKYLKCAQIKDERDKVIGMEARIKSLPFPIAVSDYKNKKYYLSNQVDLNGDK